MLNKDKINATVWAVLVKVAPQIFHPFDSQVVPEVRVVDLVVGRQLVHLVVGVRVFHLMVGRQLDFNVDHLALDILLSNYAQSVSEGFGGDNYERATHLWRFWQLWWSDSYLKVLVVTFMIELATHLWRFWQSWKSDPSLKVLVVRIMKEWPIFEGVDNYDRVTHLWRFWQLWWNDPSLKLLVVTIMKEWPIFDGFGGENYDGMTHLWGFWIMMEWPTFLPSHCPLVAVGQRGRHKPRRVLSSFGVWRI